MGKRKNVSKVMALAVLVLMLASLFLSTAYAAVQETISQNSVSAGMINLGSGNTGKLIVQFDILATALPQDSFVGFCDSSASPKSESDFPIAFKLNMDTSMAALDNKEYKLEGVVAYANDEKYNTVRMEVDLAAKKYDVYVYPPGVLPVKLIAGCSFREGVSIDDLGKACVYSSDGTTAKEGLFKIRNLMVIPFDTSYGQWRAYNDPVKATHILGTNNTGIVTTEFDVTFYANGGGIMYLDSSATGNGWNAPVIVCPSITDGVLQARNGGAYERIADVPYVLGKKNHVKVVIDINNKSYDVFADGIMIADDFKFRTGQDLDDVGNVFLLSALDLNKPDDVFMMENHTVNGIASVPATPAPTVSSTPAPTAVPAAEAAPISTENPKTNDISLMPYLIATAVGIVGAAGATIYRKRN